MRQNILFIKNMVHINYHFLINGQKSLLDKSNEKCLDIFIYSHILFLKILVLKKDIMK